MAVFETWIESDLKKPVKVQRLETNLFKGDQKANRIGVIVYDNGAAAVLSGTVQGVIVRDDDATITFSGSLSSNRASVLLPKSAYAKEGPIHIVIRLISQTSGTVDAKTVLGAVSGYVVRSESGAIVDDSQITNNEVPSITQLLALMGDMQTSKTACDTATAKIANMTVSNSTLAAGSSATATLSTVSGHYNIAFGIPKGDKGDTGEVSQSGLNSQLATDTWLLKAGTNISSGSLDNYTSAGNYRVADATAAAAITNSPITTMGYVLKVFVGAMDSVIMQMAVSTDGSAMFVRRRANNAWEAWKRYSTDALRPVSQTLTAAQKTQVRTNLGLDTAIAGATTTATDFNNILDPGIYWIASDVVTQNWPENIDISGENRRFVMLEVLQSSPTSVIRVQRLTLYQYGYVFIRYYNNGTWYSWLRMQTGEQTTKTVSLNDIKTQGIYWVNSNTTATGWPANTSGQYGVLEVIFVGGKYLQRLTRYNNENAPTFHSRFTLSNNTDWSAWGTY